MKAMIRSLLANLVAVLVLGPAQAAPLNIQLDPFPDISNGAVAVSYTSGTGAFTADGFPLGLTYNAVDPAVSITSPPATPTFSLSATISNAGVLSPGGTFSITGSTAPPPATAPTLGSPLLSGTLTALGFPTDSSGDPIEFLFTVTGGSAAPLYGGVGATGAIVLSGTNLPASPTPFANSFNNIDFGVGSGSADVGVQTAIPEPSTLVIGLVGGLGMLALRLRRRTS